MINGYLHDRFQDTPCVNKFVEHCDQIETFFSLCLSNLESLSYFSTAEISNLLTFRWIKFLSLFDVYGQFNILHRSCKCHSAVHFVQNISFTKVFLVFLTTVYCFAQEQYRRSLIRRVHSCRLFTKLSWVLHYSHFQSSNIMSRLH